MSLHCRRQKPEAWYPKVSTWKRWIVVFNINFQYPFNVAINSSTQCYVMLMLHSAAVKGKRRSLPKSRKARKCWEAHESGSRDRKAWEMELILRWVSPMLVRAPANAASLLLYCSLTRPLAHSPVFPITPVRHLGSGPFYVNLPSRMGVFWGLRAVFQKRESSRPW